MSRPRAVLIPRLRSFVQKALGRAGLQLVRHPGPPAGEAALVRLRDSGLLPRTVLDVGAAFGDWSRACAEVFPNSEFVLVEPVDEYRPILQAVSAKLASATVIAGALSNVSGTTTLNVHRDLVGSSLLSETEGGDIDGVPREVTAWRLDELTEERSLEGPFLLKVDVQGAELQVLQGSEAILGDVLAIVLEVSFLDFFVGGPQFTDVVLYMHDQGFVVYDVFGLMRRPLDGALSQADVLFVHEESPVRRAGGFASAEQRRELNERSRAEFARRRRDLEQGA